MTLGKKPTNKIMHEINNIRTHLYHCKTNTNITNQLYEYLLTNIYYYTPNITINIQ